MMPARLFCPFCDYRATSTRWDPTNYHSWIQLTNESLETLSHRQCVCSPIRAFLQYTHCIFLGFGTIWKRKMNCSIHISILLIMGIAFKRINPEDLCCAAILLQTRQLAAEDWTVMLNCFYSLYHLWADMISCKWRISWSVIIRTLLAPWNIFSRKVHPIDALSN